jgi:hypothetical protein
VLMRWIFLATLFTAIATENPRFVVAAAPCGQGTNRWQVVESANFRVYGTSALDQIARLTQTCEEIRASLSNHWLGPSALPPWQPKCVIVLHPDEASYELAVHTSSTSGSSCVDFAAGRVALRRIDLRADRNECFCDSLPHELTHVVLVDAFPCAPIPLWADEGLAMLGEREAQLMFHLAALRTEAHDQPSYRLAELFALASYPPQDRQAQFYEQSTSVVRWLVGRRAPGDFVPFLRTAQSAGYDSALRTHYGINGIAELERLLPGPDNATKKAD